MGRVWELHARVIADSDILGEIVDYCELPLKWKYDAVTNNMALLPPAQENAWSGHYASIRSLVFTIGRMPPATHLVLSYIQQRKPSYGRSRLHEELAANAAQLAPMIRIDQARSFTGRRTSVITEATLQPVRS
jgi:hypothetical protein